MKKEKLGNLISLQRGYDLPASKMRRGPYPVAGSNGIIGSHNIAKAQAPCITIGRSGSVGKVHFYNRPIWPHNTSLYVTDFKGNNPRYIYYLLSLIDFTSVCGNSVVPSLNRNFVYPIEVPFFEDRKKQNRIDNVLTLLDKKIIFKRLENNLLENMAKQMYDYWFVQFDFPDANGNPYKSSGGKMVWNEKLKCEIPEGWEVKSIGSLFDVKLGGTPSTEIKEYWENGNIHWLNSGEVNNFPVCETEKMITEKAVKESSTVFLPKRSVLLSITRHLRVTILNIDACVNQSVVGIEETKEIRYPFIYFALCAEIPRLMTLRTGAQQPHINKDIVESTEIIVPSKKSLNDFLMMVIPIFEKILLIGEEITELTNLRDFLLPLLMNGQVSIKE